MLARCAARAARRRWTHQCARALSSSVSSDGVIVEHKRRTTMLRLNRPSKRNAVSASLVEALIAGLDEAVENDSTLLVLTGEGKAFSGGFDLSGLDKQTDADLLHRFVRVEQFLQALHTLPMVTAAFVQGRCVGAAADAVACCRRRIVSLDATFRFPGLNFGLVLGTRRLTDLVGADHALDFLETSREISAQEALSTGLATRIEEQATWDELIAQLELDSMALPADVKQTLLLSTRNRIEKASLDQDLAALVRSAAQPGLKERMQRFIANQSKR